jgi:hypothetical protein
MPGEFVPSIDLSKIDFVALAKRFKESAHKNTELEVLKAAIRAQLEKLIRLNKTHTDFGERAWRESPHLWLGYRSERKVTGDGDKVMRVGCRATTFR